MNALIEELASLRALVRAMRLAFVHMPGVMVGLWDMNLRCVLMEGTHQIGNVSAEAGSKAEDVVPPERRDRFFWLYERAKQGETTRSDYPIGDLTFESIVSPVRDELGRIQYVMFYLRDVTAERVSNAKGARDSLTGLPKRGVLQAHVEALVRRGQPFHLLFIDLDKFKKVNDTMGHRAGDLLLERVSIALQGAIRSGDLAVRVGGDEFVVVLGSTSNAKEAGRRILRAILDVTDPFGAGASIGVASFPESGNTLDKLLAAADVAMYHAKQIMGGDSVAGEGGE